MRFIAAILCIFSLTLVTGCNQNENVDPSTTVVTEKPGVVYDHRSHGIGATGMSFDTPPAISEYQEITITVRHATLVYWSPLIGWSRYHETAMFIIPPGTVLHIGVEPDAGWVTDEEIIHVPYGYNGSYFYEKFLMQATNG